MNDGHPPAGDGPVLGLAVAIVALLIMLLT